MGKLFSVVVIATALLLGACTSIPLKTLYKLATTDPMAVDPQLLRAGVRMPEWVMPRSDGVKLELGMMRKGEEPVKEQFVLELIPVALQGKTLTGERKPGFELYAYRLARNDIQRFESFRNTLKANKAKGNTQGSLSVGVDACRKTELPEGKVPVTTYLKLDAESDYLPLVVDYNLKQPLEGKNLAELIPPC